MPVAIRIAAQCAAVTGVMVSMSVSGLTRADGWNGAIGLASDYLLRGISESDHLPSAQADLHHVFANGLVAGIGAITIKEGSDRPLSAELSGYLGYGRALDEDWNAQVAVTHYAYPGYAPRRDYDYDEAAVSLSYRDRATLTVTASPDSAVDSSRRDASGRPAYSYELVLRQPLPYAFSVDAGIGYNDLQQLVKTGYVYWNAGVGYDFQAFHLELAYIGTNSTARELFGDEAANRLVGSIAWRF